MLMLVGATLLVSRETPDLHFNYKNVKVARWIDSRLKYTWVNVEVSDLTQGRVQNGAGCSSGVGCDVSGRADIGHWGGFESEAYVYCYQNGGRSSSCSASTGFRRGSRDGAIKDSLASNENIKTLCKMGRLKEAVQALDVMEKRGIQPYSFTYFTILHGCINMKALSEGQRVHAHIMCSRFKPNIFLWNALVNMYAKCGSVLDARKVFDQIPERDVISWTAMIAGYARNGKGKEAIKLFWQMKGTALQPDPVTFVSVLNACANLAAFEQGKQIHVQIIKSGMESNVFVASSLIHMYAKCGSIEHARQIFDRMPERNVVSWNVMVAACVRHGHGEEAFKLFWQMQRERVKPDQATFVSILKACTGSIGLEQGKKIHTIVINTGFESDMFVGSTLVNMYAKCGSINDARQVFEKMPKRDVVTWNALIAGYAQHGQGEKAFHYFRQMQLERLSPDHATFVSILSASANLASLEQGEQIHKQIIRNGFELDGFLGSALIHMYAKCGNMQHARQVFEKLHKRDVVSWNALIVGYIQHGGDEEVLTLFHQMQQERVKPDQTTFIGLLKACANTAALEQGKKIHAYIIKYGFDSALFVGNMLVYMYANCGDIEHARQVFDKMCKRDKVSWDVMAAGYAQYGQYEQIIKLFWQMQQDIVKPGQFTFVNVLKACANLASLGQGKQIHAQIIAGGFELDVFVGSALINMYAKCDSINDARQVFDQMPKADVVLWTAMITGYAQHGHGDKALILFRQMLLDDMKPCQATFVNILKACASVAFLEQGKQVHAHIIKSGLESDAVVGSTLIYMYAKCGSMKHACQVFERMAKQDLVSWNAMVAGHAQHGHSEEVLKLIQKMQHEGVQLDHITFTCILSACSHAGLVDEGCHYFDSMNRDHGITPAAEHYVCMVDLLGRAGHLDEAEDLIKRMPFHPSVIVWGALLGACRIHSDVELAKHTAECVFELDPLNSAMFVLLSNIYAASSRWSDKAMIRKMMEDRVIKKHPACTWLT